MSTKVRIPEKLPLLFVSDGVLFPGVTMRISIRSPRNMRMVHARLMNSRSVSVNVIAVVFDDSTRDEHQDGEFFHHHIATAAMVTQIYGTSWPRPVFHLTVTGLCRMKLVKLIQQDPYGVAEFGQIDRLTGSNKAVADEEVTIMIEDIRNKLAKLLLSISFRSASMQRLRSILETGSPDIVADLCASALGRSYEESLLLLDCLDVKKRLELVRSLLTTVLEEHGDSTEDKTPERSVELPQEAPPTDDITRFITNRLRGGNGGGRKKIGGFGDNFGAASDSGDGDGENFAAKIKSAGMPGDVEKRAMKEYKKLKVMPTFSPEYSSLRNYLELLVELPWSKETTDHLDVRKARQDLDNDHCGMADVKRRVIEYLAVSQLRQSLKGPILCFVGPPGVGKTSIAKSIASSTGRKFHRISLGGISDQSAIRGHRRTYIGSMPGRIIQGLRAAGTKNPVFLLDEVDKITHGGAHGDPFSALLEVLDPEQNVAFVDHYLNEPFDLSKVIFIATANGIGYMPPPLLDRMEIIEIPGYTQEEKLDIGKRFLVPKQLTENGLSQDQVHILDESLDIVIAKYTREAGVRSLERRIGQLFRAVAVRIAEQIATPAPQNVAGGSRDDDNGSADSASTSSSLSPNCSSDSSVQQSTTGSDKDTPVSASPVSCSDSLTLPVIIDGNSVEEILGPPLFSHEFVEDRLVPGVAAGLAWTPVGGEVLWVEATRWEGDGRLTLTGQLGDVMKESATLALNWLKSNCEKIGLDCVPDSFDRMNVHIHFPAGAISKDGPSAGIPVLAALASIFTGCPVRADTAMTGEITLRGLVLPVGGIKDKVLAAHRAGFSIVILPLRNSKDLNEIPASVKSKLKFILVNTMDEALIAAFEDRTGEAELSDIAKSKL